MAYKLKSGDKAPVFTLLDQDGNKVSLKDFKDKKVLLYFYPKALTPGCTTQSCAVRDVAGGLEDMGVIPIGISPDDPARQKQFDEKHSLGFRLLCDTDNKTATAFGVWGEKSMYGKKYMGIIRSSFLIDENGKIIKAWYNVKPDETVPLALEELEQA